MLRPFAARLSRSDLWRLNHRSVPRAVAVGLGVGIIIPVLHMVIAALVAVPTRANVAIAAGTTLVVNPLTIPPLYWLALQVGRWELSRGANIDAEAAAQVSGELAKFLFLVKHDSGPLALGILTISISAAAIGYVASAFFWRHWITSKYRARRSIRRIERHRSSV